MEKIETNKKYYKKNNSFYSIFKKSYIKEDNFMKIKNNSLKSKKTQSLSTNCDDKKENDIKDIILINGTPTKCKNENNNEYNMIINSNENKNNNNQIKINGNLIIINEEIKININPINLFNISKENVNNNLNDDKKKNIVKDEVNKKIDSNKIKNFCKKSENFEILNEHPPHTSELFNNMYILTENNKYYYTSRYCYDRLNRSKIEHFFFNHIMIKNHIKNSSYFSLCINKRTKNKLITIIYYKPMKK